MYVCTYLSFCLYIVLFVYASISSIYLSIIYQSFILSIHLYISLSVYLIISPMCLCKYVSIIHPPTHLPTPLISTHVPPYLCQGISPRVMSPQGCWQWQ
jgi:hypothetical protein